MRIKLYFCSIYKFTNVVTWSIFYFTLILTTNLRAQTTPMPTVQATDILFSNVSSNQFDISWTNGDGSNRLVIVKVGSAVDATPTDLNSYIANATFGTGDQIGSGNYVVYNGTANTVTLTGLLVGTDYHVQVFEYNGTTGSENYNINTATVNPTNIVNIIPPGLSGMYFDGVDDYVRIGHSSAFDINPAIGVTYEAWVKLDDNFNGGTILRKIQANAEDKIVHIYNDGTVFFYLWSGGPGSVISLTSNSQVLPNEWTHITCTFDGANDEAKIYLNGVEDASITTTLNPQNGTSDLFIGSFAGNTSYFDGQIDELKIFDDVRTLPEIKADMYDETPSDINLMGYWSFDDDLTAGNQTTAVDGSGNNNNGILTNGPLWSHRVINTDDSGDGSLREAINRTNTDTDKDYIDFSILGGGVQTITPGSALPDISESVIIDGYSQPESSPNTLNIGNDAVLNVQLNGASAGVGSSGLRISATNSEVYGLIIHGFGNNGNGIIFTGTGNTIAGCQVGLNALGNESQNVHGVRTNVGNNIIGLPTPAGRNTITGNRFNGIQVQGSADITNLTIQNNYLGTSPDGLTRIGGGTIRLIGSSSCLIGGAGALEGNVLASSISMNGSASGGHQILGNYIGVGADGTTPLGIFTGILFQSDNLSNMQIGGLATGEANIIANNTNGILLTAGTASTGNSIRGNIMYSNTIGIDLGTAGADTNDDDDSDAGNNNLQNFPVLNSVILNGSSIDINFNVDAIDGASTYPLDIDFYISDGNRQGQTYIGSVSYTSGDAQKNILSSITPLVTVNVSDLIVATATDANSNTSEFSVEAIAREPQPFITTWTPTDGSITIPTNTTDFTYNYDITWTNLTNAGIGDGSITGQTGDYAISGLSTNDTFQVEISGTFPHFYMNNNATEKDKLLTIEQWGDIVWESMKQSFFGAKYLTIPAADAPNLTNVTSLQGMFSSAESMNSPIGHWDVSTITDMSSMFSGALIFNQDISGWNVSNVTDMHNMFEVTGTFNQPIGNWIVDNVTNMDYMFTSAISFSQNINSWNVNKVTDMTNMFVQSAFNEPLNLWDVSSVTTMETMFAWNPNFNQDISDWNMTSVRNTTAMFAGATNFNQDLSDWSLGADTTMQGMFFGATSFNQNLGSWDISSVNNMDDFLSNSGLSIENYDSTLIGWERLDVGEAQVPSGITLGASGLNYCTAKESRDSLTSSIAYNWTISGDALDCSHYQEIEIFDGDSLTGAMLTSGITTIDFGSLYYGEDSTRSFTIQNMGTVKDLIIDSIVFSSGTFQLNNLIDTIKPLSDSAISITFQAIGSGTINETILIYSNDLDEAPFIINLSAFVTCDSLMVTSILDNETCGTLRNAINFSNNNTGIDTVIFSISGTGPHIIGLTDTTLIINDPVFIDGYSQSGSSENTLVLGSDASIQIYIDGAAQTKGTDGFEFFSDSNIVQGLGIMNFNNNAGLFFNSSNHNLIRGNVFGIAQDEATAAPNNYTVYLYQSEHVQIGDGTSAGRNVFANSSYSGIFIDDSDSNTIEHNYFGLATDGVTEMSNHVDGISIENNSHYNLITDNVLSGNDSAGVFIESGSTHNTFLRNIIGLDANGTNAIPNKKYGGLGIWGEYNEIGDGTDENANIISGNDSTQLYIAGRGNVIWNNLIGPVLDTTALLNVNSDGIKLIESGDSNSIFTNIIAYNLNGISTNGSTVDSNRFVGNSIYSNTFNGIVEENGSQGNILPPNITILNEDSLLIGTSSSNAFIQIFADSKNQGKYFIGTTTADVDGNWTYGLTEADFSHLSTFGLDSITAIQDSNLSTSEFSIPIHMFPSYSPDFSETTYSVTPGSNFTKNILSFLTDLNNNLDTSSIDIITPLTSGGMADIDIQTIEIIFDLSNIPNFSGEDSLQIYACDDTGLCDSSYIRIDINENSSYLPSIIIYNLVTPNGDGNYDHFRIDNIEYYDNNSSVHIFDKWGDRVFAEKGYGKNGIVWEGKLNNKYLYNGTYYYVIKLYKDGNRAGVHSGFLELNR